MSNRKCGVFGCSRRYDSRGFCGMHAQRFRRTGDPEDTTTSPKNAPIEDRLKFHGWTTSDRGCWEWSGLRDANGYGVLRVRGRTSKTHRIAYETWVGPIPEGLHILHSCDNPPCINPNHLRPGTNADNVADKVQRGRALGLKGERHHKAVLTEQDVLDIRLEYATGQTTYRALARFYDISSTAVGRVVRGEAWSHV